MNIFNKYGIKEVADVIFYHITRIGDEEFYTPVLFFDTLKVSSLNKSVEVVNAKGGKGNGKILSWNFEQDSKLKLEDALFSQMSLDVFLNGRAMAKMSDWTMLIAKLNIANKFGQKNYSIKAFPSPELTEKEKEILFRCAEKAGYDPERGFSISDNIDSHQSKYIYDSIGQNSTEDTYVARNRKNLLEKYYKRQQSTPQSRDLAEYIDFNLKYDGVQIILEKSEDEKEEAILVSQAEYGDTISITRKAQILFKEKNEENYFMNRFYAPAGSSIQFSCLIEKTVDGLIGSSVYFNTSGLIDKDGNLLPEDLFSGMDEDKNGFYIADEFVLSHLPYFVFPQYLELAIKNLCYCDQRDKSQLAMPEKIISAIVEEINEYKKIGYFVNDLYEINNIDRFEKCIVKKKDGLVIDLTEQNFNIKKYYRNDIDNFTIFYDEKTMLPFVSNQINPDKIYGQKIICLQSGERKDSEYIFERIRNYYISFMGEDWTQDFSQKDYLILFDSGETELEDIRFIKFKLIKHEYITLKYGMVYYKFTRTINSDITNETFLGTNLSIDVDSFPGEYLIVGETYVREQKTGKDQRCQLLINRAAVSSTTKIQLQASGEPTTFSLDIDLLVPKNSKKSTLELRQYNVDEDEDEGGTYIVPQSKKHSYTQPIQTIDEILVDNNEIY